MAASAGVPASASTAAIVFAVLLVPAPTISCAPRSAHTARAGVDHRPLLVGVERRRLAGGAEGDDPGAAGVEVLVAEPLDRVEGDRAVGGERGDERDVDALEQTASLRAGSRPRGYRVGHLAGPEKDVVEHRLGELAGERVLLRRVVAAEHDDPRGRHLDRVAELRAGRRAAAYPRAASTRATAS